MTPKVTQSTPKAPQREPKVASRAPSGVRLALWKDPWAHVWAQRGLLGRPWDPLGVSWTSQGSTVAASGDFWLQNCQKINNVDIHFG